MNAQKLTIIASIKYDFNVHAAQALTTEKQSGHNKYIYMYILSIPFIFSYPMW